MNLKKFISGVSALTIAASAFAAMAVTANAVDETLAGPITAQTDLWTNRDNDTSGDYQLVYEADVLVNDGGKAQIVYFGGNNNKGFPKSEGPGYIFDGTHDGDYVYVQRRQGPADINTSDSYTKYKKGYTAHIKIVTAQNSQVEGNQSDNVGNSVITFSFDDSAACDQGDRVRYPYQNREVTGRNLNGDAANEYVRAIRHYIDGDAQISNVHVYTEKLTATPVEATNIGSFDGDEGASVYTAAVTNDSAFATSNVKAVAVSGTDEAEDSAELTVAAGSAVEIAVIVEGKTADAIDSLTVSLY